MKHIGKTTAAVRPHPHGGWTMEFTCPAAGCGRPAVLFSDRQEGPYDGCCPSSHRLHIPHFKAS